MRTHAHSLQLTAWICISLAFRPLPAQDLPSLIPPGAFPPLSTAPEVTSCTATPPTILWQSVSIPALWYFTSQGVYGELEADLGVINTTDCTWTVIAMYDFFIMMSAVSSSGDGQGVDSTGTVPTCAGWQGIAPAPAEAASSQAPEASSEPEPGFLGSSGAPMADSLESPGSDALPEQTFSSSPGSNCTEAFQTDFPFAFQATIDAEARQIYWFIDAFSRSGSDHKGLCVADVLRCRTSCLDVDDFKASSNFTQNDICSLAADT